MSDNSRIKGSLIGQTIGGFQVQTLIGRGAMGTVYLAKDMELNRQVALKVLLGSMAQTPSIVRQFQLEAQAAAPLKHPNVVRVYSAGMEKGTPYMAMEFVDGEPLDRFLRRKGKLKWQQAFHIGAQVALALECAHRNNIVHRDVKPSNIMLDRLGTVRLTDFGIANIQTEGEQSNSPTFVGTPQYMSPEQCTNQPTGPASDLFSLGVTMYQMIAGEMPFHGESSMSLIKSICIEDPPRLNKLFPSMPDDVARLVAYLLEKKPEMRPANARVVYTLIDRLQEQKGGVSVVNDALTAFLKEEMEPRPFANVHSSGVKRKPNSKAERKTTKVKRRGISRRTVGYAATVAILALGAMSVAPVLSTVARESGAAKAEPVSLANFRDMGQGQLLAQFFADGYRFRHITWIGSEGALLVEAEGLSGTLTHNARGLIAVSPSTRRITSVRAPWGPALDGDYWRLDVPDIAQQFVPPSPESHPLSGAVLLHARESADGPLLTLAQVWDESAPRPAVLYRSQNGSLADADTGVHLGPKTTRVIPKPDGYTLCLVRLDGNGQPFLAERDVRLKPLETIGQRLTKPGAKLLPRSVQYSPQGEYLAYLRLNANGKRDLWAVHPERGDSDDKLILADVLGDGFAIRPDGSQIAVEVEDAATGKPSVLVVDVYGRQVLWNLGEGRINPSAWMPSGRQLVVIHGDKSDPAGSGDQLWLIEVTPPFKRTQLTHLAEGLLPFYAISPDGQWVAAVSASETFPTLAFLETRQAGLDSAT